MEGIHEERTDTEYFRVCCECAVRRDYKEKLILNVTGFVGMFEGECREERLLNVSVFVVSVRLGGNIKRN
jgi:hypothetical protein